MQRSALIFETVTSFSDIVISQPNFDWSGLRDAMSSRQNVLPVDQTSATEKVKSSLFDVWVSLD